jgi:hypothetical protein
MDFIPRKRAELQQWLGNLSSNVIAEVPKFGAPAADGTAMKALADDALAKMNATDAAEAALDGVRQIERATLAAAFSTLRAKVRNWKTLPAFPASGSEAVLKLKGAEVAFDPETYKPVLTVTVDAGKIRIDFKKNGADGLAVFCRLRGTAAWRRIGMDTSAPYFDTAPLATPNVPEVREYMARGMVDDEEIGLDSDIVSIAYGG